MRNKIIILFLIIFSIFSIANLSFAQGEQNTITDKQEQGTITESKSFAISGIQNPLKKDNIKELLYSIVDLAVFIGVIIAVIMFIVIGFKFVLAQGNQVALQEARKWFLYAVIGTAVLISAKVIVEVIKSTFISTGLVNEELFNNKTK